MDTTTIIIICVVVAIFAIVGIISFISTQKIKKEGIETEAQVSRIDVRTTQTVDNENGTTDIDTTETYYVEFKTQDGQEIEALLPNPAFNQKEGDIIKIKYLADKPNKIIRIKEK